jgi:hypothetical protein
MALNSVQSKTSGDTTTDAVSRPPIWVEGRQRPKFDLAAFVHVATAMARRDLVPAIDDARTRLDPLGHRVLGGDLRVTARWVKRLLPAHQKVGAAILGLGRLLGATRDLIVPPAPPAEPIAYPHLVRREVAVRPEPPIRPEAANVEPTLHAIRSAISTPPHDFAQEAVRPVKAAAPVAEERQVPKLMALGLLGLFMLFAWPGGAGRALLYHLDGGDLRDWS